jgi:hypothetical protein
LDKHETNVWGFTSRQFSIALQHIIIGILLGLLGYQVQQKVITISQANFIYNISDSLFLLSMIFGVYIFLQRILTFRGMGVCYAKSS